MIITCPNCSAKFSMPDGALPAEGHEVKCSNCAHVWFQKPVEDELDGIINKVDGIIDQMEDEAIDDDAESASGGISGFVAREDDGLDDAMDKLLSRDDDDIDLPDSIRPDKGSFAQEMTKLQGGKHALHGYAAAGAVFVVIFLFLLMMSGPIAHAIPGMQNFYGAVGMHFETPGKGLVFDKLVTKIEPQGKNKENIYVEGNIINLTGHEVAVPPMKIELKDDTGHILATWFAMPPADSIEPEATLSFQVGHENTNMQATSAAIRFVLNMDMDQEEFKTSSKDGENNHAPHKDDQAHPSGHE